MKRFWQEFMVGVREGPRIFFAPVVAALHAIKAEMSPRPARIRAPDQASKHSGRRQHYRR